MKQVKFVLTDQVDCFEIVFLRELFGFINLFLKFATLYFISKHYFYSLNWEVVS